MNKRDVEKLIPAIDLIGGKCVRLTRGDYNRCTTYAGDPLDAALRFEEAGLTRLHLVDLDGARAGAVQHAGVLERIVSRVALQVDFSGGIRSFDDVRRVLDAGASWACIGSMAVEEPEQVAGWMERAGADRLIIGADTLDGTIRARGWQASTRLTIDDLIGRYDGKIRHLMCTDIARDGTLEGPNIPLYSTLLERYPNVRLIASGGVRDLEDAARLVAAGLSGVIIGKAFHEGRIPLDTLLAGDTNT
ncbi:MAG: 1-(5-phosphoribosyl)-5-[(5-phosphoribosylamino)methylideneamino] imidazole-4-carboxamide isomerase [Odoribacteraceae bacterium]|jgi:phosphoribosylformimino-5-aminoimidazole carboxamide ribotide isomerase|nr:1-(5-phosphoribosyl)-5-[(5-phosphoribosylamino)methylideneamino] imidazole-4-carboxamide isomerase [Odoribacteraceae bacterium]